MIREAAGRGCVRRSMMCLGESDEEEYGCGSWERPLALFAVCGLRFAVCGLRFWRWQQRRYGRARMLTEVAGLVMEGNVARRVFRWRLAWAKRASSQSPCTCIAGGCGCPL